jgi:hypothetical protein
VNPSTAASLKRLEALDLRKALRYPSHLLLVAADHQLTPKALKPPPIFVFGH